MTSHGDRSDEVLGGRRRLGGFVAQRIHRVHERAVAAEGGHDHPVAPSSDAETRLRAERRRALDQIESLGRTFDDIVEASESVATDDEHDPEGHTIAWERQQTAALLRSARNHLAELDRAIAGLGDGSYGTCTSCGEPIGEERLAALPATTACVACAT